MNNPIKLSLVDFTKPWWRIITDQKVLLALVFVSVFLHNLFLTLVPFLIVYVLENGGWTHFYVLCVLWLLIEMSIAVRAPLNARFQLQCIHSVLYSAHRYLLTIDPQYHVKRSSGVILAKIERAGRGFEEVLDQITYEFAPLIIGIASMVVILSHYSWLLVFSVFLCLAGMTAYGYYFARYACRKWENAFINSDDEFRSAAFENLAQVHLIRATFASGYMRNKLFEKINKNSSVERDLWLSYSFVSRVLGLLYAVSVLILLGFFLYFKQNDLASLSFTIGLILAYVQSTRPLLKILQPFRRYMRGYTAIQDLFDFMPYFGKQTIPVFESSDNAGRVIKKDEQKSVIVQNMMFTYGAAKLFDNHTLRISTGVNQSNKLYGIIGPSGVGKTTLLSILGGQLRPLAGSVIINGIDIYAVGDDVRRQLIALQGQIATSVKGTVRYNLLFGLPENHGYSDDYLREIIQRVGLEQQLFEHQGLDTMLGEGALNISGGQRQRLNFAGLYLRACYYKPALILIDEPTSSLDEISELAVTAMINELAEDAITLVIAHRLKTLKDAVGLIDLSLVTTSQEIQIHSAEELEKYSAYYQHLLIDRREIN